MDFIPYLYFTFLTAVCPHLHAKHLRFLFPARAVIAENTEIPAHGKAARRDFQYKMEKKEVA